MSLPVEIAKLAATNPELVTEAVRLTRALLEGKSGAPELKRLKTSVDAERERRRAIAAAAKGRR